MIKLWKFVDVYHRIRLHKTSDMPFDSEAFELPYTHQNKLSKSSFVFLLS
jgi:hypothetical protein